MKFSIASLFWLLTYIAMIAAVVGALVRARRQAIATYGSPEARAEWEQWRVDADKLAERGGPVKRGAPKSAEPPALVLMRDHFVACLAGAVLLSSVLFGTFWLFVQGAFAPGSRFVDRSQPPKWADRPGRP